MVFAARAGAGKQVIPEEFTAPAAFGDVFHAVIADSFLRSVRVDDHRLSLIVRPATAAAITAGRRIIEAILAHIRRFVLARLHDAMIIVMHGLTAVVAARPVVAPATTAPVVAVWIAVIFTIGDAFAAAFAWISTGIPAVLRIKLQVALPVPFIGESEGGPIPVLESVMKRIQEGHVVGLASVQQDVVDFPVVEWNRRVIGQVVVRPLNPPLFRTVFCDGI